MNTSMYLKAAAVALGLSAALGGCGSTSAPLSQGERNVLRDEVTGARTMFMNDRPVTRNYFSNAYAYVIFPSVKGGAIGVGGAGGQGEVFVGGKLAGTADITQMNIGVQLGGQEFAEVVFFKDAGSYAAFTNGEWEFDAKASAVAADAGASATADYQKGVAVFTIAKGGLMAQAAIGTQKLRFRSNADQPVVTEK